MIGAQVWQCQPGPVPSTLVKRVKATSSRRRPGPISDQKHAIPCGYHRTAPCREIPVPDAIEVQILDTLLGLSLTSTTAEQALLAGRAGDGGVLSSTSVATPAGGGAGAMAASEQVVEAVMQLRSAAATRGQQVHLIGVTWTDEAVAVAALVLEKLTDAGLDNVVPVRFDSACTAAATAAQGAAVVAAQNTAFPDVEIADLTLSFAEPAADDAAAPMSMQYAGAVAALIIGALTFVVSLSLAVSLQHAPPREYGQIEQVANTTEPGADRHDTAPAAPQKSPAAEADGAE